MASKFVHLHVHSEYSLLDGLAKIDELINKAVEYEMPALAVTDHGSMHGVIEFYTKAKTVGIKPIIGIEGYLAKRSRFDKEAHIDVEPYHITLLAKNLTGYRNLMKISSKAHLEGFYYKPRIDKEILNKYSEGIICLSGCIDGEIPRAVREGRLEEANRLIGEYLEIFGKENFYLEVMHHDWEFINETYEKVISFGRELNLPVVATNDVHYVDKNDAYAQDVLLAIQAKETVNTPKRKLSMIDSPTFYLRSPNEMQELFYTNPEACENSFKIADKIDLEIPMNNFIFPEFPVPEGKTAEVFLSELVKKETEKVLGRTTVEAQRRIEYELEAINSGGYAPYILIFADLADFCKKKGVLINTRGSAAGSLVLYILGITNLNPLTYSIPFERFLYKGRPSPPDIDLDIQDDRRDEVIEYVREKYGWDHVAQIVTFGRMEARAAIRDVARALGQPYSVGDRLAKTIPFGPQGFHAKLEDSISEIVELRELYKTDRIAQEILDLAIRLQGVARHASTHAAGVIVTDEPITNYAPLMYDSRAGKVMTQYDMYSTDLNVSSEALGLLKMDFLGLRHLTVLQKSIQLVKKTKGIELEAEKIPLDDAKVFAMISQGETTGVFQLESAGMRRVARELRPNRVEDLMVMVSLFRPGPMDLIPNYIEGKKNPSKIKYIHPALKDILADTYGVLVYQDQCLKIFNKMAGFSMGEADILRRAIGKKKRKLMQQEKKRFIAGSQKKGFSKPEAEGVFSFIEKFAAYGFNQGHAAAYGMIVYQTAYMKANFPVEYMTAMLTCEAGNTEKIALLVSECNRLGIKVLPPEINSSESSFVIQILDSTTAGIRFGLSAIKNVGEGSVEVIIKEREKNGPFISIFDLCQRVDLRTINKKVLESLIRAGAFDSLGSRAAQLKALPQATSLGSQYQKKKANGQVDLFESLTVTVDSSTGLPEISEVSQEQKLTWEKELLGFYLTQHPMSEIFLAIQERVSHRIGEVSHEEIGSMVKIGGWVTTIRKVLTRKNSQEMAFVKIQDTSGAMETIVFPKIFQESKEFLTEDRPVIVSGRVDNKEESELKVIAEKIVPFEEIIQEDKQQEVTLEVPNKKEKLEALRELLLEFPGNKRVTLKIENGKASRIISTGYKINFSPEFKEKFELLFR